MKITYHFTDRTVEIDVPQEWADFICELDRQEYNIEHKETRRHCSLEAYNLDGNLIPSGSNPKKRSSGKWSMKHLMQLLHSSFRDRKG